MKLELKVEKEKLQKIMRSHPDELRPGVEKLMFRAGTIVQTRAVEHLAGLHEHKRHWITGTLARSIQVLARWVNKTEIETIIGNDNTAPYAKHVEALPDGGFLTPAIMDTKDETYDYITKNLSALIKRITKK